MNEKILALAALQKTAREAVAHFPGDIARQETWAVADLSRGLEPGSPHHAFILELVNKPSTRADIRAALAEARG
jgi:hypothetical protein